MRKFWENTVESLTRIIRKLFVTGGWAPCLVFSLHVLATRVFGVYEIWPPADIPMHFAGGLAIAFFMSQAFRALPREVVRSSRLVVLEAILVLSLTISAAVVWEFAEFSLDTILGSNVQVSLANTMQDLAMGMLGSLVMVAIRARQTRTHQMDVRHVAQEWLTGQAT